MLSILRTNQATANIFVLIYLIILRLPIFIFPQKWEPITCGIFSKWLYQLMGYDSLSIHILTTFIIVFTAIIINQLAIQHKLGREINLLPGLFYCTVVCLVPNFLVPVCLHFANLFLILAIAEIFSTYRRNNCEPTIFNIGLLLSLSSLFYFSYSIFIFLGIIGLNSMRALKFKEILIMFLGFLTPLTLLGTGMFWFNQLNHLFDIQFKQNFGIIQFESMKMYYPWIVLGVFGLFLLLCIFSYGRIVARKKMQDQKKINVLYWTAFLTIGSVLIQANIGIDHLLILAVPIGTLIGLWITTLPYSTAEIIHLLVMAGILLFQYSGLLFR